MADKESPTTIDEIPWVDKHGKIVLIDWEVLRRPTIHIADEETETVSKTILWQRPPGPTVAEWLPEHLKKLDANARIYDLAKSKDKIPDEFFERYKEYLEPSVKVEAQLLILFRLALHQTKGTIGSEIAETVATKVERRNAVVAALVLGDTVFIHVSPAVGDSLDIEEIPHERFKQLLEKGDELRIIRATRSRKKISEPME